VKLRTRLLVSYLLLVALPLALLGGSFYNIGKRAVAKQARENVYEIVKKNNEVLDTKLKQLEYDSVSLFADKELFGIFDGLDPSDPGHLLDADRKVGAILSRQFSQKDDLYAYQLWTSYYSFGYQRSMPQGDPTLSAIYEEAIAADGKMVWYPTYDFTEMFGQQWLREADNYDYRYLFTAARKLNFSHLDNSTMRNLDPGVEAPVLAVSLKADLFRSLFEGSIPESAQYMVVSREGSVVAHSDSGLLTKKSSEDWIRPLLEAGTGTRIIRMDGKNTIVLFDRSAITGWLSLVLIPEKALASQIVPPLLRSVLTLAILLAVLAITLAFVVLGRIIGPLKKLFVAMRLAGDGDFQSQVVAKTNDEIGILLRKFNTMNARIRVLVNENYEIKLKEQAAEIQALNLQMNPHFLYNTLNVMNWTAIENGQKELSKMLVCLSNMLHYTTRKDWNAVHLSEEIEWMKNYFYIMSVRFENKFSVRYEIDPRLYSFKVPKLLFQPFVENAILHGFDQMESGGIIFISGKLEGNMRVFRVEDNGRGIDPGAVERIRSGVSSSVGIATMISRIQLRYGERLGERSGVDLQRLAAGGTAATIVLPAENED